MADTLYKVTTYTVSLLVQSIAHGKIALPDIQRPFVWHASKVRELFDSMYKGFPVGYLLFGRPARKPGHGRSASTRHHPSPRISSLTGSSG
jgi:uncharacterized protein with ParB-like and HNH nuclease domain